MFNLSGGGFSRRFKVVLQDLTRVTKTTRNISMTTKPMNAHLSNPCKQALEKSKAYQSMGDLFTPLTLTQPPIDRAERGQTGVKPPVQR